MIAVFSSEFVKGLLHGALVGITLWIASLFVIDRQLLVLSSLFVIFLPLLIIGCRYRRRNKQSLIQHMIIIKERIFLYPFGVALCFSFIYIFAFLDDNILSAYNPLYLVGVYLLALLSITAKVSIVIWVGSLFNSTLSQHMLK